MIIQEKNDTWRLKNDWCLQWFYSLQWEVDNSLSLCKFDDVTLEACRETKPEFQIQISLATDPCYWGRWEQQQQ